METLLACPDCGSAGYHYEAIDATPTMNLRESPKHTCALCGGTGVDPASIAARDLVAEFRSSVAGLDDARRRALEDEIARRNIEL